MVVAVKVVVAVVVGHDLLFARTNAAIERPKVTTATKATTANAIKEMVCILVVKNFCEAAIVKITILLNRA